MKIIEVIPAINLPSGQQQIFTYFCSFEPELFTFVIVPVRKKMVAALVVSVSDSDERKIDLKSTTYQLKGGVLPIKNSFALSKNYVKTIKFIADYYFCSLGMALKTALPNYIFKRKSFPAEDMPSNAESKTSEKQEKMTHPKPAALIAESQKRKGVYTKEIKKTIEEGGRVLLLVPERSFLNEFYSLAEKAAGKENTALIHSDLKEKDLYLEWQKARSGRASVIVGTRSAIFCDLKDLSLIIVEKESNSSYKSWDMHPKYDARTMAIFIAKNCGARILFGDSVPRSETYNAIKNGTFDGYFSDDKNNSSPTTEIIDMKKESEAGNVSIFSRAAVQAISDLKKGQKAFVFINRRGDSPVVFCRDCGYIEMCQNCAAPLVFHKQRKTSKGVRDSLVCHRCGLEKDPPLVCQKCGGHRIKFFGSGTQKFEEELTKTFPGLAVVRVDADTVAAENGGKDISGRISAADIIVGTSLAMRYFDGKFDVSLVGLADPVFYFPDFRSGERFFSLLKEIEAKTISKVLIQTFKPDNYIFRSFTEKDGDPSQSAFLENELKTRKALSYPPFSQLIKISFSEFSQDLAKKRAEHDKANLLKMIALLEKDPSTGSPQLRSGQAVQGRPAGMMYEVLGPAPSFIPKVKNRYVFNVILKDKAKNYRLRKELLAVLSKYASVDVDPDSTL